VAVARDAVSVGKRAVRRGADALAARQATPLPTPLQGGPFEGVETDIGMFWMQTCDEVMRPYLQRRRVWEEAKAELLDTLLRPGARFLDVGANVGYFSVFAHRLGRGLRIDAVEPQPVVFDLLQANLWSNAVPAATHRVALGHTRALTPLSIHPTNPGDARVGVQAPDGRYDLVVPMMTADELFRGRSFDVVKIDVQGFEPDVVLGMERIVYDSPAIVLIVEFWPTALVDRGLEPAEVLDRYRRLGYHISVNDQWGTGTCFTDEVIDHCRSAGPDGQVNLVLRRDE